MKLHDHCLLIIEPSQNLVHKNIHSFVYNFKNVLKLGLGDCAGYFAKNG